MSETSPARILQIATGHWASRILATAVEHKLFQHLEEGAGTAGELAARASIAERGAQALLDGALGLGLVTRQAGRYRNSPEASAFLVQSRPTFLGFAAISSLDWPGWAELGEAVRQGTTTSDQSAYEVKSSDFFERLVSAIAPLAVPAATTAAERLALASRGAFRMLDVGGGSGVYSALWLAAGPQGRATQLDWPNVNRVARARLDAAGLGERFECLDGNLLELDFGEAEFDYGVYSHMAHGLSPEQNRAVLAKFRRALKPGGTLVVADFVLDDERRGHPMALMFFANMLHATAEGQTYTECEYREWLRGAGFPRIELQALDPSPVTLVYAA